MSGKFEVKQYNNDYNLTAKMVTEIAASVDSYSEFMEKVKSNPGLLLDLHDAYHYDGNVFNKLINFSDGYEELSQNEYGNFDEFMFIMFQFAGVYDNDKVYQLLEEEIGMFENDLKFKYLLDIETSEYNCCDGSIDYYFSNGTMLNTDYEGKAF